MNGGSNSDPLPFRRAYRTALADYLRDPTETALALAYELGREAVSRELSVLDLTVIHQENLMLALTDAADLAEAKRLTSAGGDFFLESLSSFEMVQRGLEAARRALRSERRNTELSRQLSSFLTDASLALDASNSLDEMLRLVAELARELIGADCCVATVALAGQPRAAEGASHAQDDTRWTAIVRWLDLSAVYDLVRLSGGSLRIAGEQLARVPAVRIADGNKPLHGWLAASLTALDGSALGAIQLFDKHEGRFTGDDEAALIHLAQMASAAVERTRLYQQGS